MCDGPVDPDRLAAFVADGGHELVFATVGEKAVGFASGTILLHPDKAPAFFVNEGAVLDGARRRGIAATLCDMLLGVARARGGKGVWCATEPGNTAARALYSGRGSRETTGIVVHDWDGAMDDPAGADSPAAPPDPSRR